MTAFLIGFICAIIPMGFISAFVSFVILPEHYELSAIILSLLLCVISGLVSVIYLGGVI